MPSSDTLLLGPVFPALAASKKASGDVVCLASAEATAAIVKELAA